MTILEELKALLARYPNAKMLHLDRVEVEEIIAILEALRG